MKKRGLALLLACMAETFGMTGVPTLAETVEMPTISYEEFPKMDGSLACVPLLEGLAIKVTGCDQPDSEKLLDSFSNTNPCYLALAQGERDFCIAYEPAQETVESLKAYAPLTMTPVGRDALVFMVNKDNPVDTITVDQARDIYTGKITNWQEVGGEDVPILAFTRPETSGSQTLMRKLLIGDAEMVEDQSMMVDSMEGIIEALKSYDNSDSSIGYSVYYYATKMFGQPDLKFLKIDDVEPSTETIADGSYSLVNDFYFLTREDSPETAKELGRWLASPDGQELVEECGYVPVQND